MRRGLQCRCQPSDLTALDRTKSQAPANSRTGMASPHGWQPERPSSKALLSCFSKFQTETLPAWHLFKEAAFDQISWASEVALVEKAHNVARRPGADDRQPDFFGAYAPKPERSPSRPVRQPKPWRDTKGEPSASEHQGVPGDGKPGLAASLSPAELGKLVALLPDDDLARLVIAAIRQLRRRLTCGRGVAGKGRTSALSRAVQEVAAELNGEGDDESCCDWDD